MSTTSQLAELLQSTAAGDRAAFAALYAETSAQLFGVAYRVVRRRDWAEEVLQEAYLRIWNHAGRYDSEKGAPMTWMIAIARNRALDWRRSDRGETSLDEVDGSELWADPAPGPLDRAILSAEAQALLGCMDGLEDKQRHCIVLAFVEGYTHEELAHRMDCPLGTVKSWIRRGQIRIRDCLER